MVTNPNTKDLYEEKDKVILQHDEKQRILSGITSNPAYIDRATNPDAYRDYLKDFLDKEKIIDVLVI